MTNPFKQMPGATTAHASTLGTQSIHHRSNRGGGGFQGAHRNATQRFLRMRDEFASRQSRGGGGGSDETLRVIGGGDGVGSVGVSSQGVHGVSTSRATQSSPYASSSLPPAWVDVCKHVSRDIEKARERMDRMQSAQQKALLPTFEDDVEDEKIVEQLTTECGRIFKRCEMQLKQLGAETMQLEQTQKRDDVGTKMRKNATRKLAMELSRSTQLFRAMQKEYLRELKNRQDRGPGAEGVDHLEEVFRTRKQQNMMPGDAFLSSTSRVEGFVADQGAQSMMATQVNRDVMRIEAEERDTEVRKILQSISDLAMVMQDMSNLIIDQGTILDSIEYNCATTAMSMEAGRKELVKAEETQRAGVAIVCIYFLTGMCILMLFIVIGLKAM